MENIQFLALAFGALLATLGSVWLCVKAFQTRIWWVIPFPPTVLVFAIRHFRKAWPPLLLMLVGLCVGGGPLVYNRLVPIDLGPREKIVNGERHLTLTGWDRRDYDFLGSKNDAIVLQMANPSVTNDVLSRLQGFTNLRELDLNTASINDQGLKHLRNLTELQQLRLRNTKITDFGFQNYLAPLPKLNRLDLAGTDVSPAVIDAWQKAAPNRRALR